MTGVQLLAGERKEGETDRAVIALNDYLRMGAGRSLPKLLKKYSKSRRKSELPTDSYDTLQKWSSIYGWQERASTYDTTVDAARTEEINRLRTEGVAADYERIRELGKLFYLLRTELGENGEGLWYKDTKISSKGDTVDVDVFNAGLLTQFRGVLDDIAKEVGGRKQQQELKVSGKVIIVNWSDGTDEDSD